MTHKYGSENYYKEIFSDIIGDCATGTESDETAALNIMRGFEAAILSWIDYHEDAAKKYVELHRRFLICDTDPDRVKIAYE